MAGSDVVCCHVLPLTFVSSGLVLVSGLVSFYSVLLCLCLVSSFCHRRVVSVCRVVLFLLVSFLVPRVCVASSCDVTCSSSGILVTW